jgi:hypothetical protein
MTAKKRLTAADYERLLRRPDADKKPSKEVLANPIVQRAMTGLRNGITPDDGEYAPGIALALQPLFPC